MPVEETALDAFVVSFATLSRMGEVLAPGADGVARDCSRISQSQD